MSIRLEGSIASLRPAKPSLAPTKSAAHPAAVALARAHKLQERIDRGEFAGRAELARELGFTLARVSQILDLTLLAPDIQEEVLELNAGESNITEWDLRWVLGAPVWAEQGKRWAELQAPAVSAEAKEGDVNPARISSRRW